jgi:putative nucleotidyltransferase with HDIG domain
VIVVTVAMAVLVSGDSAPAELVPIVVFGKNLSIAFHRELALLFSAVVTLIVVVSTGQGLSQFMILYAAAASSILLVGNIRNRRKLIYVGLAVGFVAMLTTIGVETLAAQPFSAIWPEAFWYGLFSVFAGLLMLGLLPFIESLFGVQTELSLLELGDVAHPLLQELVRRAPGTYNHSINVASIAEAAAESIGAKGLLVRVGAYFHDIGKMLKPGYFVENQGHDANRHESLVPAMSTLIIIAHIKDGADLARQHRLPKAIIDFIEQHHGTTLVEYFFRRANESKPEGGVDENNFRYPGPKPQTKEAAVLMLADAVEGASRALVEPTPARIESLVHDIAMKRLLDGQFDACGLTLQELATIEDSLVKSLTAVYHGRVKYPDQRTA